MPSKVVDLQVELQIPVLFSLDVYMETRKEKEVQRGKNPNRRTTSVMYAN